MIVEFLEGRDFMAAWLLATAQHRLSVLGSNAREMTVAKSRILNSAEYPDPGDKGTRLVLLRAVEATRRALAADVDLSELWEILDGEGTIFSYDALASLYFSSQPSTDEVSAISRAVFSDGLKFRFGPEGAVRHSAEEVERLLEARRRTIEAEQTLTAMADWIKAAVTGSVAFEPPEADRARELLLDLALWGEKAGQWQEAKKLLERALMSPDESGAFKALVALGEFSPHENVELRRLDVPLMFNAEATAVVASLTVGTATHRSGRQDLTGLKTMTIDSNGARDLDDAISIKSLAGGRWQVGLHITDVAAFVTPGSTLDNEARARGSSIYLPEGKYPMLPAELSEGLLSLTPGEIKPALSFLATVEKDGRVSDYSLVESLIRVDRQLSFADADQNMDEDSDLVDLWDLAQTLIARRELQGGMNLNIPKLNVYFLPDGALGVGLTQWDTPAKTIVGELMILANYLAADLLHKHGFPCPYRFQEKARKPEPAESAAIETLVREGAGFFSRPPRGSGAAGKRSGLGIPSVKELQSPSAREPAETPGGHSGAEIAVDDLKLALSLAARRRTGRSGLSFAPAAHNGLGLPVYTAFTAPMRRYVDLLVARQLRSLVATGAPAMDQQQFLRLALPAHELAQRIQKMQNGRQRYWLKSHLADKVGQHFSALVFERNDRRLRVCVTDYMLETDLFLPKSEISRPSALFAQRLMVRLVSSSPQTPEPPRFEVVL